MLLANFPPLILQFEIRRNQSDIAFKYLAMLKLTKKADYGLIAMKHLAEHGDFGAVSAKDLAEHYAIPQEALAKILQRLVKSGLLRSLQGIKGGYVLARDPRRISALEVIKAIDGPLFLTSCSDRSSDCDHATRCTVREPLRKVSQSIQEVLNQLSIWDMRDPDPPILDEAGSHTQELVLLGTTAVSGI